MSKVNGKERESIPPRALRLARMWDIGLTRQAAADFCELCEPCQGGSEGTLTSCAFCTSTAHVSCFKFLARRLAPAIATTRLSVDLEQRGLADAWMSPEGTEETPSWPFCCVCRSAMF